MFKHNDVAPINHVCWGARQCFKPCRSISLDLLERDTISFFAYISIIGKQWFNIALGFLFNATDWAKKSRNYNIVIYEWLYVFFVALIAKHIIIMKINACKKYNYLLEKRCICVVQRTVQHNITSIKVRFVISDGHGTWDKHVWRYNIIADLVGRVTDVVKLWLIEQVPTRQPISVNKHAFGNFPELTSTWRLLKNNWCNV